MDIKIPHNRYESDINVSIHLQGGSIKSKIPKKKSTFGSKYVHRPVSRNNYTNNKNNYNQHINQSSHNSQNYQSNYNHHKPNSNLNSSNPNNNPNNRNQINGNHNLTSNHPNSNHPNSNTNSNHHLNNNSSHNPTSNHPNSNTNSNPNGNTNSNHHLNNNSSHNPTSNHPNSNTNSNHHLNNYNSSHNPTSNHPNSNTNSNHHLNDNNGNQINGNNNLTSNHPNSNTNSNHNSNNYNNQKSNLSDYNDLDNGSYNKDSYNDVDYNDNIEYQDKQNDDNVDNLAVTLLDNISNHNNSGFDNKTDKQNLSKKNKTVVKKKPNNKINYKTLVVKKQNIQHLPSKSKIMNYKDIFAKKFLNKKLSNNFKGNFKRIIRGVIRTSGGVVADVATFGAGGDVIIDALFAVQSSSSLFKDMATIIHRIKTDYTLTTLFKYTTDKKINIHSRFNFDNGFKQFENNVLNAISQNQNHQYLMQTIELINDTLDKIITCVSDWLGCLFPDTAGLAAEVVHTLLNYIIKNGFSFTYSLVSLLPDRMQMLITDSIGLKSLMHQSLLSLKKILHSTNGDLMIGLEKLIKTQITEVVTGNTHLQNIASSALSIGTTVFSKAVPISLIGKSPIDPKSLLIYVIDKFIIPNVNEAVDLFNQLFPVILTFAIILEKLK